MTHAAPRRRGGKTWILPAVAVLLVGGLVASGILSRAVALDALSWWPVWLVLAAVAFWGRALKVGALRVPGLVSVATVLVVGVFLLGHLQGWGFMPSAQGLLSGSGDLPFTSAALSARVPDGTLAVGSSATGVLYTVEPIRRGGDVGLPSAVERAQEDRVAIELTQEEDPGWLLWEGWDLELSTTPEWTITLEGDIDADLRGLSIENLQVSGGGSLALGTVSRSTPVTVAGDFLIVVPADAPVRVIGPAQIPGDWERSGTGAASPIEGQGWVISVPEGSVVEIRAS